VLLGGAATVAVVAGLRGIADLAAPAFLALVLTICAHPLRRWLTRHRVPGWVATTAVVVTVYLVLLVLLLSLVVSVAKLAELLPTYEEDLRDLAADTAAALERFGVKDPEVTTVADALDPGRVLDLVTGVLDGLVSVLSDLAFVVTLLLFLAVDAAYLPAALRATGTAHAPLVQALTDFAVGTRRYLVVSTVFGLVVALLDVALLTWLDIPAPWLWGAVAFVTNYIPNIGFVIGLVPPTLLGLLEDGWAGALAVVVGYCVLNVVIQSVIQPRFVGQAVGLSTSLTFLSLVFWAWVLGPLGALLAVPLSLFAKALLVDADPRSRWLVPVLSGRAAPAETSVQERLEGDHQPAEPPGDDDEDRTLDERQP